VERVDPNALNETDSENANPRLAAKPFDGWIEQSS
jgi:hypothetical protein